MLGIGEVTTPVTGNCMAMAVAQAAVDATLEGPDSALKSLTASIKRGIKYAGLLHLEDQMAHDHRVNALANVRRGWPTMTRSESATQMRWFLEDYANSPSSRSDIVSDDTWGGSDTLGMAAIFLQRDIFTLEYVEGPTTQWRCRKISPSTITKNGRVVETANEYPMSIEACLDEIQSAKIDNPKTPPLIVRYWGRHYSAFLHSGRPITLPDLADDEEKTEDELPESEAQLVRVVTEAEISANSVETFTGQEDVKMGSPWDPTSWNGDVAELWDRLEGFTIHHTLKQEIYSILTSSSPSRYPELITFLTTSVTCLSLDEQQALVNEVKAGGDEAKIQRILQKYQIPMPV
ncbi:hypothetical protein PR003_g11649 [Phytophthora rubi]|uniref:Uncharacterized protein n=1 Tax=Phytophthora rubi TaxID=129364 RepID=A0A6A4FMR2_9STRA|nr:hypothetical protein PR003_g11649 [Phytophthora rubi]